MTDPHIVVREFDTQVVIQETATQLVVEGSQGPAGKTLLNGSGAPSDSLGVNGDFYYDPTAKTIYGPKASGSWPAGVTLQGDQGDQGIKGDKGDQGDAGTDGLDGNNGVDGQDGLDGAPGGVTSVNGEVGIVTLTLGDANPSTATTEEMTTGTETSNRLMSPALVKASAEEHGGGSGGLFTEFEVTQTTTDNSEVSLTLTDFPTISFNELYLITVRAIMYASGGAKVDYFEHTYAVERHIGLVASINPLNSPVISIGELWGKNSASAVLICAHDTSNSKPLIKVRGDASTTEYWKVVVSYRKMFG